MDLSSAMNPTRTGDGGTLLDTLPFSRLSDMPPKIGEDGITNVYTKEEIDIKISNVTVEDVYTKSEIDALLSSIEVKIDEDELNAMLMEILV